MAEKGGNEVKAPVKTEDGANRSDEHSLKESLAQEHHGESTDAAQEDRRIGQNNAAGRPPLMKK